MLSALVACLQKKKKETEKLKQSQKPAAPGQNMTSRSRLLKSSTKAGPQKARFGMCWLADTGWQMGAADPVPQVTLKPGGRNSQKTDSDSTSPMTTANGILIRFDKGEERETHKDLTCRCCLALLDGRELFSVLL